MEPFGVTAATSPSCTAPAGAAVDAGEVVATLGVAAAAASAAVEANVEPTDVEHTAKMESEEASCALAMGGGSGDPVAASDVPPAPTTLEPVAPEVAPAVPPQAAAPMSSSQLALPPPSPTPTPSASHLPVAPKPADGNGCRDGSTGEGAATPTPSQRADGDGNSAADAGAAAPSFAAPGGPSCASPSLRKRPRSFAGEGEASAGGEEAPPVAPSLRTSQDPSALAAA